MGWPVRGMCSYNPEIVWGKIGVCQRADSRVHVGVFFVNLYILVTRWSFDLGGSAVSAVGWLDRFAALSRSVGHFSFCRRQYCDFTV